MLQSIQFNGSGPPTYVYAQKAVGATTDFYYVFATETRGYDSRSEEKERRSKYAKREAEDGFVDLFEFDEFQVLENHKKESLQEVYQREYGRRESFLWKQR